MPLINSFSRRASRRLEAEKQLQAQRIVSRQASFAATVYEASISTSDETVEVSARRAAMEARGSSPKTETPFACSLNGVPASRKAAQSKFVEDAKALEPDSLKEHTPKQQFVTRGTSSPTINRTFSLNSWRPSTLTLGLRKRTSSLVMLKSASRRKIETVNLRTAHTAREPSIKVMPLMTTLRASSSTRWSLRKVKSNLSKRASSLLVPEHTARLKVNGVNFDIVQPPTIPPRAASINFSKLLPRKQKRFIDLPFKGVREKILRMVLVATHEVLVCSCG